MRFVPFFLLVLLAAAPAAARPMAGERPVWIGLGVGFTGTAPAPDTGFGVAPNITVGLRFFPVSPELILRDGVLGIGTENQRHFAGVGGGVRFLFPRLGIARATARVAFAHQHELAWAHYTESVGSALRSTFGVHDDIVHRSGVEFGGGVELTLPVLAPGRLGTYLAINGIVLPGTEGPPVSVTAEIGVSISLGKPLKARE